MPAVQSRTLLFRETSAMAQRQDFLRQRRAAHEPGEDLDAFAQGRPRCFVAAERAALGHELARFDLDVPAVEGEGERYQRVLRCATTYTRAGGPGRVERSWDRHPHGDQAVCPRELRAGIIEGAWTSVAAQQATWGVAHLTPHEGEELFALFGHMPPSKSTLAR